MNDYIIITDATCDLTESQVKEYEIEVMPFEFFVDGKSYYHYPDSKELDLKVFYNELRDKKPGSTSQITTLTFKEFFAKFLKEGKDVIYIGFSSAMSATFNNAVKAKEELLKEYPLRKVEVVDSKSASMGQGLLVYFCVQSKKKGLSIEENRNFLINTRDKVCHYFTVDDLNHLKRSGRLSSAAAFFGIMMGIKPILHVDIDGRLEAIKKVRGRKTAVDEIFNYMENLAINPKEQKIFISHADCLEDAEYLAKKIKKKWGIKDITINYIGPIIGTHTGPGTLAIFYLGTEK